MRFHLRVAALHGHDPADPRVAADFLVLRGVHKNAGQALADLNNVRATPLPPPGERTPLRSWYQAVVRILILAGFLSAPDEDEDTRPLTRWEKVTRAVRFIVAGLIWALTWVVPVTFMIMMSWACESDARRFGQRVTTHYTDESEDIGNAIASADRKAGGNRALTLARGALVVVSVAIPLALIAATVAGGQGPLGVNVPEAFGALAALGAGHRRQHRRRARLTTHRHPGAGRLGRLFFHLADFARKVIGVGSVGTPAWIALLLGRDDDDPLVLQIKEAEASVLEEHLGRSELENHGQRVVTGQRLMQATSDILLGWLRVASSPQDGKARDFYCRQLKDWKGSAEIDQMTPQRMAIYGNLCGWTLARAHARSGDRVAIASYLGSGPKFRPRRSSSSRGRTQIRTSATTTNSPTQ